MARMRRKWRNCFFFICLQAENFLTFIRFQNVVVTTKVAEAVISNTYTVVVVKVVEKSGRPFIASHVDVRARGTLLNWQRPTRNWIVPLICNTAEQVIHEISAYGLENFVGYSLLTLNIDLVLFSTGMLQGIYINQINSNVTLNNVSAVSLLGNINYRF